MIYGLTSMYVNVCQFLVKNPNRKGNIDKWLFHGAQIARGRGPGPRTRWLDCSVPRNGTWKSTTLPLDHAAETAGPKIQSCPMPFVEKDNQTWKNSHGFLPKFQSDPSGHQRKQSET